MQARTRTLLFVLIVVLFLVVAPLLVLYAKGYSFSTDRREVVRTGMILIDTNVPKVTVRIDGGEPFVENDPVILRSLEAGTYSVELSREGYEPWAADLPVEIEKVTRVDDLLLTLSTPEVQQPITNEIGEFAVSPNSRFAVYSVTAGKDQGVWMHTSGEETNRKLIEPEDLDPTSLAEIRWAQNSRLLLLRTKDNEYWRIAPHVTSPLAVQLKSLAGIPSSDVSLDLDEPTIVYYQDAKDRLLRWSTARPEAEPEQLATAVLAFSVASPKVFTLSQAPSGKLTLSSYDMREAAPQADLIAALPATSVVSTNSRIITQGASSVAVLNDQELWLLGRVNGVFTFSKLADAVDQAEWSPKADSLFYQQGLELWAYDREALSDQPEEFRFATLTELPSKLSWHPAGHYIVILDELADSTSVRMAHVSRTAPAIQSVATISTNQLPQFARGGLDVVYNKAASDKSGLVYMTITEQLD
jgi:hypothetical protein